MRTPEDEALDFYSRHAPEFAEQRRERSDVRALERFAQELPRGARVLDAGCGCGEDLLWFAAEGFAPEGFDGSSRMLELARTNLQAAPVKLWQGDFRFLKLEREAYDGIWANQSLIHLSPVLFQRVVQTFFMGLKRDGALFLSFVAGEAPSFENATATEAPRHRYPATEIESMLRQSGFQPLSTGKTADLAAVLARRI